MHIVFNVFGIITPLSGAWTIKMRIVAIPINAGRNLLIWLTLYLNIIKHRFHTLLFYWIKPYPIYYQYNASMFPNFSSHSSGIKAPIPAAG